MRSGLQSRLSNSFETRDFHDMAADVTLNVIQREIGHYLRYGKMILVFSQDKITCRVGRKEI